MKKLFIVTICFFALVTLNGQIVQERLPGAEKISNRRTSFNLEEIKVRWKKAALENCPGVPCIMATVPGPPTSVTASAGNAKATVSFTAPSSNGGSAITGYTVTSSPGDIKGTGSSSPITVNGLTNGTAYTFTIVATNVVGNSVASAASSAVTPMVSVTVPGPPTSVTAVAGNGQATVSFTAPASNGGSAITGYTVTSSPGGITGTGSGSPITLSGLSNGTAYTFSVVATNAIGNSSPSTASSAVTPSVSAPGSPTSIIAVAGNAQATISFTAPASDGGSAITGYTVTSSPGGITGTGSGSPIIVSGLTNGTVYTFTVLATNAIGNSSPSTASCAVIPAVPSTACGSVTSVLDRESNTYATVSIGTQCWMASNLMVTTYNDGTNIPLDASGGTQGNGSGQTWLSQTTGARTLYGHDNTNLSVYGYLYNGHAVVDSRKICPSGWHVPTNSDWNKLVKAIDPAADTTLYGESLIAGGMMKSTSLWNSPNTCGNNSSGFAALPSGERYASGLFYGQGNYTSFWSTTIDYAANSFGGYLFVRELAYNRSKVYMDYGDYGKANPIRCVKD